MESRTSRRALLLAAPAAAVSAAIIPTAVSAPTGDEAILRAFGQWKALHAERDQLPASASEEEYALWDRIDLLDKEVHDLPATTPVGVACKLWIALTHNTDDRGTEAAAFRADLAWFDAQDGAPDWNVKCIVSALRALTKMGA